MPGPVAEQAALQAAARQAEQIARLVDVLERILPSLKERAFKTQWRSLFALLSEAEVLIKECKVTTRRSTP